MSLAPFGTRRLSVESSVEHMEQSEDQVAQTQFLPDLAARGDEQAYEALAPVGGLDDIRGPMAQC